MVWEETENEAPETRGARAEFVKTSIVDEGAIEYAVEYVDAAFQLAVGLVPCKTADVCATADGSYAPVSTAAPVSEPSLL